MATIPLWARDGTIRGRVTVDDVDFEALNEFRWHLHAQGYAMRRTVPERRMVLMHRQIMGLDRGDPREVDHRDLDRLNCRRSNLRIVTHAQNAQNVRSRAGARSKHRGVGWHEGRGKWRARVMVAGREHCAGWFIEEDEAARAAEALRKELMPYAEA